MNAFGSALNLVFMRRFASHEFLFPANESQNASHEFLFPANESQNASHEFLFPANESQNASHEFKFLFPANESQNASHEFLFPANESQNASHEFLSPLPNFWSLLAGYHPCPTILIQNVPIEAKKLHSGAILGVPLYIPHGYP